MDIQSSNLSPVNHDIAPSNDRASEQFDGDSNDTESSSEQSERSLMRAVLEVVTMEEQANTLTRLVLTKMLTMVSTAVTVVFVTMEE